MLARLLRRSPDLRKYPLASGVPVSVIIPARNEAATITTLLDSLAASRYAPLEILVVNDRSTDDTAALVTNRAANDARIRLIEGAALPDGWLGKPWACAQGAALATGDVLIFTDADTTHHPDLHGHTVAAMQADAIDLLTLASRQLCETFWERLVMPQIWALLGLRYPPAAINRATRPHQVVANGQYIAFRRRSYQALGGHDVVKGEVVEDLALAQHALRAGLTLRMMHAESLLSTRMYRSLAEMAEGWTKNLHVGARQSLAGLPLLPRFASLGVMLGFLFWLVPPILLAAGILTPAMLLAIGLSMVFWVTMMLGMQIPIGYALGYPLGAATALVITLRSTLRGSKQIEWRGRVYDLTTGRTTTDHASR